MKKTQIIAITIAVIAVLWVGSGVLFSPDAPEDHHTIAQDNKEEETLAEVRVRQSKAEDFSYDIVVTGRSEAEAKVQIRAEISGRSSRCTPKKATPSKKERLWPRSKCKTAPPA